MEPRFHAFKLQSGAYIVAGVSSKEWDSMDPSQRTKQMFVTINTGGMISPLLASTWAKGMAEQLNQFDVANAAVAKLT
jgi:hypothetical protein